MARPRKSILSLDVTPYYHCTSRCVRGSYLCGIDKSTGHDYSHRRKWLRKRILFLSDVFSIKIAAFAIMENHFHAVLFVDSKAADDWSTTEVVQRWHKLFNGTELSQKYLSGETLEKHELTALETNIKIWRESLKSISWFMRCAKEPLARMANNEDNCKGRFWEGRFHCQALLDSKTILACMTYVDLNPLRANMCHSPEEDQFTSLNLRVNDVKNKKEKIENTLNYFSKNPPPSNSILTDFSVSIGDYLNILDITARVRHSNKRGVLNADEMSIFQRIGFNVEQWISAATTFNKYFHAFVGKRSSILKAIKKTEQSTAWGIKNCETLLGA